MNSKGSSLKQEWRALWENKTYLFTWMFLLFLVLTTLKLICFFLNFNENRTVGIQLNDFVLQSLTPTDVSIALFSITWICIFCCLPFGLYTPKKSMVVFISIIIISIFRTLCLYLVPLIPPEGIIPLRDPLLEGSFYDDQVMVRDLFFSGHTANVSLLFFFVDIRWIKIIIAVSTFVVGFLLLKQHVHYTIDVIVAPFFAFASYKIAVLMTDRIMNLVLVRAIRKSQDSVVSF